MSFPLGGFPFHYISPGELSLHPGKRSFFGGGGGGDGRIFSSQNTPRQFSYFRWLRIFKEMLQGVITFPVHNHVNCWLPGGGGGVVW